MRPGGFRPESGDAMTPVAEILRSLPPAKRAAALRYAEHALIDLLDSAHQAVGFPKPKGWNPVLCLDLEAVRRCVLEVTEPKRAI